MVSKVEIMALPPCTGTHTIGCSASQWGTKNVKQPDGVCWTASSYVLTGNEFAGENLMWTSLNRINTVHKSYICSEKRMR